jgi:hypothetical protein
MTYMSGEEIYDWADDDDLDMAQTLKRLDALVPAIVIVSPGLAVATAAPTAASSNVLTKSFYSSRRQAVFT